MYVLLMNLVDPCMSGCNIFLAVTEIGMAAVTRYMSLAVCLGCCEMFVIVSSGFSEGCVMVYCVPCLQAKS